MPRPQHDHWRTDLHPRVQVDRVLVGHADTAGRNGTADVFGLIGAVDAVERILVGRVKVHAPRAERIVRPAGDIGWQRPKAALLAGRGHPSGPFFHAADLEPCLGALKQYLDMLAQRVVDADTVLMALRFTELVLRQ